MSFQFFTSSQNGTILSQSQEGGGERPKARSEDKQTTLAVTIRSIENALQGDELSFFGSQPEILILVASVESVSKQAASMDLVVNDATGRIRVRQYLTGDSAPAEGIEAGRYVQMFGQVRSKPEPHFMAQSIRPVKSADEVSYHMIECAHSALRLQRGPSAPAQALGTPVKSQAPVGSDLAASTFTPPKAQEPPQAPKAPEPVQLQQPPAASPAVAQVLSGAPLREAMLAFLTKEAETKGVTGCSRDEVFARFKTSSEAEMTGLLSEMIADADIISTIDDDHFGVVVD